MRHLYFLLAIMLPVGFIPTGMLAQVPQTPPLSSEILMEEPAGDLSELSGKVITGIMENHSPNPGKIPEHFFLEQKEKKEFKYASDPDYWMSFRKEKGMAVPSKAWDMPDSGPYQTLVLVFFIALAFIITYFFLKKGWIFKNTSVKAIPVSKDFTEENLDNLDERLKTEEQSERFRNAVRILFLKVMDKLRQKDMITYRQKYTNTDYRLQLKDHSVYPDFDYIARIYEFIWYGETNISKEQYRAIKEQFKKLEAVI